MMQVKYANQRVWLWGMNVLTAVCGALHFQAAKLTHFFMLRRKFKRKLGYQPDFQSPKTFNERIQHKKLYDRNPLLSTTSDKLAVRSYVLDVLGESGRELLIPLLAESQYPEELPFDRLPDEYVIKANHGCGTNLLVREGSKITKDEIIRLCYRWLRRRYGMSSYQWAYTQIKKRIIVEELLLDENGKVPDDFKIHVLNGRCLFVQVDSDRHDDEPLSRSLYDPNWDKLPFSKSAHVNASHLAKPERLQDMIERSIQLAAPFEYARVDWYSVMGRIYLGEITQYPGGGLSRFCPNEFDAKVGMLWESDQTVADIL
jgi:hypothetical protein